MITHNKESGFSLMELMIAIAIIGILSGVAIPSYQRYTKRAHFSEVIQAATPYKVAVEECYQYTGTLNKCNSGENGIPIEETRDNTHSIIHSISTQGGTITMTPNEQHGITAHDTYILTPEVSHSQLFWSTSGGSIASGLSK